MIIILAGSHWQSLQTAISLSLTGSFTPMTKSVSSLRNRVTPSAEPFMVRFSGSSCHGCPPSLWRGSVNPGGQWLIAQPADLWSLRLISVLWWFINWPWRTYFSDVWELQLISQEIWILPFKSRIVLRKAMLEMIMAPLLHNDFVPAPDCTC